MWPENFPVPEDPGMTAWDLVLGPFSPIMPVSVDDALTYRDPRTWEYVIGGIPAQTAEETVLTEARIEYVQKDPSEMTPEEVHEYVQGRRERFDQFRRELTELINRLSMEQDSDTPDFLIAEYLIRCLKAYNFSHSYRRDESD